MSLKVVVEVRREVKLRRGGRKGSFERKGQSEKCKGMGVRDLKGDTAGEGIRLGIL